VEHLRSGSDRLQELLIAGVVDCHPFVIGELACGNLRERQATLGLLERLPRLAVAEDREVRHLVEARSLHGKGLGWVDVHLLASALIARESLWTLDQPLAKVAGELGIGD
jgi:predicted nucleic acid-binding protein